MSTYEFVQGIVQPRTVAHRGTWLACASFINCLPAYLHAPAWCFLPLNLCLRLASERTQTVLQYGHSLPLALGNLGCHCGWDPAPDPCQSKFQVPHGLSPGLGVRAIQLGKLRHLHSAVENSLLVIRSPSSSAVHTLAVIGCM